MKISTTIVCYLITAVLCAQSGVQFEGDTWEEVKARARSEDKLIFLDAYATWCVPCKQMDIQVFNRTDIGDYFNEHFINFKMDLEKGIGPILAARYNVSTFPALLFLTADETLVHKALGYKNAPNLMAEAKHASRPEQISQALDQRYDEGDRKPDFLRDYTYIKYKLMDGSHKPIIQEFIKSQKDFSSEANLKYIYFFTENFQSKMFPLLARHRKDLYPIYGNKEVDQTLQLMVHTEIYNHPQPLAIDKVRDIYATAYPDKADWMFFQYQSEQYLATENYRDYATALTDYWNKYPEADPDLLIKEAKNFDNWFQDKIHRTQAIRFVQQALEINEDPAYYDLLADLYQKVGEKKLAKKTTKKKKKLLRKKRKEA